MFFTTSSGLRFTFRYMRNIFKELDLVVKFIGTPADLEKAETADGSIDLFELHQHVCGLKANTNYSSHWNNIYVHGLENYDLSPFYEDEKPWWTEEEARLVRYVRSHETRVRSSIKFRGFPFSVAKEIAEGANIHQERNSAVNILKSCFLSFMNWKRMPSLEVYPVCEQGWVHMSTAQDPKLFVKFLKAFTNSDFDLCWSHASQGDFYGAGFKRFALVAEGRPRRVFTNDVWSSNDGGRCYIYTDKLGSHRTEAWGASKELKVVKILVAAELHGEKVQFWKLRKMLDRAGLGQIQIVIIPGLTEMDIRSAFGYAKDEEYSYPVTNGVLKKLRILEKELSEGYVSNNYQRPILKFQSPEPGVLTLYGQAIDPSTFLKELFDDVLFADQYDIEDEYLFGRINEGRIELRTVFGSKSKPGWTYLPSICDGVQFLEQNSFALHSNAGEVK